MVPPRVRVLVRLATSLINTAVDPDAEPDMLISPSTSSVLSLSTVTAVPLVRVIVPPEARVVLPEVLVATAEVVAVEMVVSATAGRARPRAAPRAVMRAAAETVKRRV